MRKTRKTRTIAERAEAFLREHPALRRERTMRLLAERIAYHELKAEEAAQPDSSRRNT